MHAYENLFINGKWVPSGGTGTHEVTDAATEEVIATIPEGNAADVDAAVSAARAAFPAWSELRRTRPSPRGSERTTHSRPIASGRTKPSL